MEKNVEEHSSKIKLLKNKFREQRDYWINKVTEYTKMMNDPKKLVELEIIVRNEIMAVSDEKANLLESLINITKILKDKKAKKLTELKVNSDFLIKNKYEQDILIDQYILNYSERQDLLSMQIEFIDRTYNNLKDISWGIQRYVDLYKAGIE